MVTSSDRGTAVGSDGVRVRLVRLARLLGISAAVVFSLLTFPAGVPWMIALWLAWHTWVVYRGRTGWFPLMACAAVVAVKRMGGTPVVWPLLAAMLAVAASAAWRARETGPRGSRRAAWAGVGVVWFAWAAFALDWHAAAHCGRSVACVGTRPVVCLGDSLTSGLGPQGGYPECLAKRIRLPVVNLGQPGISSRDALEVLPEVVAARPQIVVVELGGHDYLKGFGRAATEANLEKVIAVCQEIGADVMLMEVPRGLVTDPFAGLERELARRHDLELISDTAIRWIILFSPRSPLGTLVGSDGHLADDGLHPNARGNEVLAVHVARSLARLCGPRVRVDAVHFLPPGRGLLPPHLMGTPSVAFRRSCVSPLVTFRAFGVFYQKNLHEVSKDALRRDPGDGGR